jgi:hypothetical protein
MAYHVYIRLMQSSLYDAIEEGDIHACISLLEHGVTVDYWTWLTAIHYNQIDICKLFIDGGYIDINIANNGWTAIHEVALCNHVDLCRVLMDRKVDTSIRDQLGYTPLEIATYHDTGVALLLNSR